MINTSSYGTLACSATNLVTSYRRLWE